VKCGIFGVYKNKVFDFYHLCLIKYIPIVAKVIWIVNLVWFILLLGVIRQQELKPIGEQKR
jgi:hypothetical protein